MIRPFVALFLLFASSSLTEDDMITAMRAAECRGDFSTYIVDGTYYQRQRVAMFLELRRRGEIPPYSMKWCVNKGIVPAAATGDPA